MTFDELGLSRQQLRHMVSDRRRELVAQRRRQAMRVAPVTSVLSARELEVLGLIAAGLTDEEIAGRLGVARDTVKTHVRRLRVKLGASNRAAAVAIGFRGGWLS